MKKLILLSIFCTLLLACEPAEKRAKRLKEEAESLRIHCLDNICKGDLKKLPPYNYWKLNLLKLNNVWYTAPRTEFNAEQNMAQFNWPIKETGESNLIVVILFTRPKPIKPLYELIQIAEKNNWILSRKTIKKGLDKIIMKHIESKLTDEPLYIDQHTYYIATDLKEPDGMQPVARCDHKHSYNSGNFYYHWKDNIYVSILRMNQGYCEDFPEIYKKTISLLKNIKRLTP